MIQIHNATLLQGDCLQVLQQMEAESVQTCVTSPPYWGLRDYDVEGQLGLEPTPGEYVEKMVAIFREVKRVLKPDGTLWLNLGDTYARDPGKGGSSTNGKQEYNHTSESARQIMKSTDGRQTDLPPKNLVGIPWRVAFALQADGWYLRCDIIWHKPNPMPESVTDRPTKAHEYIFLLTKSERYYYDHEAIKEPVTGTAHPRGGGITPKSRLADERTKQHNLHRPKQNGSFSAAVSGMVDNRNKRSVWTVATKPYPGAHFAVFPPKLIEPCILAGSRIGDTVLDPFNGSGTTGIVAVENNRKYIGIDLNGTYLAEQATPRLEQAQQQPTFIF